MWNNMNGYTYSSGSGPLRGAVIGSSDHASWSKFEALRASIISKYRGKILGICCTQRQGSTHLKLCVLVDEWIMRTSFSAWRMLLYHS